MKAVLQSENEASVEAVHIEVLLQVRQISLLIGNGFKTYQARVIKLLVRDSVPLAVARYIMLPLTQPIARFPHPAFVVAQHAH